MLRNFVDVYQEEIFDKHEDEATGYRTASMLTVPIPDAFGQAIGILQLINKVDGRFTEREKRLQKIVMAMGKHLRRSVPARLDKAYEKLQDANVQRLTHEDAKTASSAIGCADTSVPKDRTRPTLCRCANHS